MKKVITRLDAFFKLDTKKIIGQASYLFGGQIFGNIMSFLVALAAAHFISKETYGTYRYILSVVSFIGAFSLTGLSTAIIRSVARGHDHIFKNSFKLSIKWSLPAIIGGICLGVWYFINGNNVLGTSMVIGGITFPFIQALLWYKSYLNGKVYFKALMKSNIAYSAVTTGTIILTLFSHPSVVWLVIAYYASNIVVTVILAIVIRKRFKPNDSSEIDNLSLAKHMSLMNVLDICATQLDKIIIFQVAGPIEVARYTFATLIPEQLRNILKYIPTISLPKFSALSDAVAREKAISLVWKLFLITIPCVILYIFIAPTIYKVLFPSYGEVIQYSQVFAFLLIFDGGVAGALLKAKNQITKLYWVNITSNIIKIILLVALGMLWGIWGVIFSRIISRAISFLLANILIKQRAD